MSVQDDGNVPLTDGGDGCTTLDVFNATEFCILKLLKWQIFCVFNHNKKKVTQTQTRLAPSLALWGLSCLPLSSQPSRRRLPISPSRSPHAQSPQMPTQMPSQGLVPPLWPVPCSLGGGQHPQLPFSALSSGLALQAQRAGLLSLCFWRHLFSPKKPEPSQFGFLSGHRELPKSALRPLSPARD